jgi:hypothetical protein
MPKDNNTAGGTFLGGDFHTLPFLISNYHAAIAVSRSSFNNREGFRSFAPYGC